MNFVFTIDYINLELVIRAAKFFRMACEREISIYNESEFLREGKKIFLDQTSKFDIART